MASLSFCGVISNKSDKKEQADKLKSYDTYKFSNLERELNSLTSEAGNLEREFHIKAIGVNEWQNKVQKNFSEIRLIAEKIACLQNVVADIENISKVIDWDIEELEVNINNVCALAAELDSGIAEPQRFAMYQILFDMEVTLRHTKRELNELTEYWIKKPCSLDGNLSDVLDYHLRILGNIENKLDSLAMSQEVCQNSLDILQQQGVTSCQQRHLN